MQSYKYKQEIKFIFLSFIALFTLWIILSGYFEPFFLFCGLFSSAFTLFLFIRLVKAESALNHIISSSRLRFYSLIYYIPWLAYQMIISSIYLTKKVLLFNSKLKPIVILMKCKGHNDESIALFANSVTITPGTLTINIESKQQLYLLLICLIDKELKNGIYEIEDKILNCL